MSTCVKQNIILAAIFSYLILKFVIILILSIKIKKNIILILCTYMDQNVRAGLVLDMNGNTREPIKVDSDSCL